MLHKYTEKHRKPFTFVEEEKNDDFTKNLVDANLLPKELQDLNLGSSSERAKSLSRHENRIFSNKYVIPDDGVPEQLAFDLVRNELTLDGNPHLNLASFVNTSSTALAKKLITENINKNLADNDEYPQLIELTERCISMLAQLWKCGKNGEEPIGCATTGSSEAIMLGGLAMKKRWEHKMKDASKSTSRPNIIMSSACQVALEKFARYFEVECRLVPVSSESHHSLDPKLLWDFVDENTIGVFVILGTTYTGHFENVEQVANTLQEIETANPTWSNREIPIHVDGASGGFILPFSFTEKQLAAAKVSYWGFNHPRVLSMNSSSQKFGMTTPGLGWVLWRDGHFVPSELRFTLRYLGGVEETFGLNFSRPGFQVIHQYYNFISLGFKGYQTLFNKSLFVARAFCFNLLKNKEMPDYFEVVSGIHNRISDGNLPAKLDDYWRHPDQFQPGVPLAAFKLSAQFHKRFPDIPQAMLSTLLRLRGWIVPNYPLPKSTDGSDQSEVLRVVFRSEMRLDLAQLLLTDIQNVVSKLIRCYSKVKEETAVATSSQNRNIRGDVIFDVLSTLADPAAEQETPAEEVRETRKKMSKNYRGTC